jgi:protein-tyrosine kinase
MADRPHRKSPFDPRQAATPAAHDDLFAQHGDLADYFSDGPAPAPAHEFIDSEAATRVSNQRLYEGGLPASPFYDNAPEAGWHDPEDPAAFADPNGLHYNPGYYPDPAIGDDVPTVGGDVVDPLLAPHGEYGLALHDPQAASDAAQSSGTFSWIRENAADHVGSPSPDLVLLSNADGYAAAQFRALRYRLEQEPNIQVVVVTSAREGDGKSVMAANLALALAEGGRIRVLLVDAALRNPAQHKLFGIRGDLGLTSVLAARQNDPSMPIDVIRISTSLSLIPAGPPVQSAYAALSSEPAAVLLGQIRKEYRYIIVDSSPVFGTAETLAWHSMIDKYILVARAGKSTSEDLTRASERLQRDRILGVSFVGAPMRRE